MFRPIFKKIFPFLLYFIISLSLTQSHASLFDPIGAIRSYFATCRSLLTTTHWSGQSTARHSTNDLGSQNLEAATSAVRHALVPSSTTQEVHHGPTLNDFGRYEVFEVTSDEMTQLNSLLSSYQLEGANYFDLINEVYQRLKNSPESTTTKERSEEMSLFASQLMAIVDKSVESDDKKNLIAYQLGAAVLNLELMPASNWVERNRSILKKNKTENVSVHLNEFTEWTQSYIQLSQKYTSASSSVGTVLSDKDILEIMLHNHWPVTAKRHDSRHIHFAVGNPLGPALVFKSMRTTNMKRNILLSMLFEGVERFQFLSEFKLTRYMHNRGYNLTSGLLYLARASERELDEVIAASDLIAKEVDKRTLKNSSYKPSLLGHWTRDYVEQFGLEQELDVFIENQLSLIQDPANQWFTNYSKNPPPSGSEVNDLTIHH